MSSNIKKSLDRQLEKFYDIATSAERNDDLILALTSWTVFANGLEVEKNSDVKQFTLYDKDESVSSYLISASEKIEKIKKNIRERYVPENDSKALCRSFAPVEFIQGSSPECRFWFDTLVGLENEKREIRNGLIHPLRFPKLYGKLTKGILLYSLPGLGKCLDPDTPVIMFDGSVKKAKEIQKGDQLMGDDSGPRTVISTCSGKDEMYKIVPTKGEPFTVNEPHVLTLVSSRKPRVDARPSKNFVRVLWMEEGKHKSKSFSPYSEEKLKEAKEFAEKCPKEDIVDIPLNEYLQKSEGWKMAYKGFRTGVDFPERKVSLDPYILGAWLGDGKSSSPMFTNIDKEVLDSFQEYADNHGLEMVQRKNDKITYGLKREKGEKRNHLTDCLREYDLIQNKHIPQDYLHNSREVRLQVLAGLIDTDGYYSGDNIEITQKNESLSNDIAFLARSLGFYCSKRQVTKACTNSPEGRKEGVYYRMNITGKGIEDIPTKIARKIIAPRRQIKDANRFGFKVKPQGKGDYCGFELDGNGRFLLGDFTVTHNTAIVKASINELTAEADNIKVLFYSPSTGQLKGKYFGESEKMIFAMFDCASQDACAYEKDHPGVKVVSTIFLDEIDSIAGNRSDDKFMSTTVNALLQVMDGVKEYPNVTLIAATNFPWSLDSAILRRFTTSIFVRPPSPENIYELFSLALSEHISNIVSSEDAARLLRFCNGKATKKGNTPGKPCQRPKKMGEIWSRPPYASLMRNLDPLRLRAIARVCAEELYSNSDIARLFKNVIQRVADQAVSTNTFVEYSSLPQSRRISTLSFYPHELYELSKSKDSFNFITPPKHFQASINNEQFISQTVKPFFNISDPSILEVFIGDVKVEKGEIVSYDYLISFVVELQQEEPQNYTQKYLASSTKAYETIRTKLAKYSYSADDLSDISYAELSRVLGEDVELLKDLYIPGMVRKEYYFLRGSQKTKQNVARSTATMLSQGWRYLTGTVRDWSKTSEKERAEYIASLSVLSTLSRGATHIYSTWFQKAGTMIGYPIEGDVSLFLNQRLIKVSQSSIFDVTLPDLVDWDITAVLGAEGIKTVISPNAVRVPYVLEEFDYVSYYYYVKDKTNVARLLGRFPEERKRVEQLLSSKSDVKERGKELAEIVEDISSKIGEEGSASINLLRQFVREFPEISDSYQEFRESLSTLEQSVISLNITAEHFVQAKKEVKATARKEDSINLEKYAANPSGFTLEKK